MSQTAVLRSSHQRARTSLLGRRFARRFARVRTIRRWSSEPLFQGFVRWMGIPTSPHLNGPHACGGACRRACAKAKPPTRSSAYTVPGRAQDSHPHSLKRARSSPTPASCPTQPSLPITPGFYHDSYMHAQKHPRMWHSSAVSNHTYAHAFCFPRSKSR